MTINIAAARQNLQARTERERVTRETRRAAAKQAVAEAIKRVVADFPELKRVYLFGSVVRPNAFRSDSDVDVAVEGVNTADYFAVWRAIEAETPGWTIDLRDITRPSEFSDRVRLTGVLVYERSDQSSESRD